jgi:hypothetical protein
MPQKGMPKGCCRQRLSTVNETNVKNNETPQSMCTTVSGAPNWCPDKAKMEGGAMVTNVVGIMRAGHRPTMALPTLACTHR